MTNSAELTKLPPQALDLEVAVLGASMLESGAFDTVAEILTEDCFYATAHQLVFRAMKTLSGKGQPIDILTVIHELTASGAMAKIGTPYEITKMTNDVVSSANTETHARIVLQKFIQRELIRIGGQISASGFDQGGDVFDQLDRAEQDILSIGTKHLQSGISTIGAVLAKTMSRINQWRQQDSTVTGVPSGFPKLDRATRGWQSGDLIILAARPSVGKTALALKLGRHAAKNPIRSVPVAAWSLEMEDVQLALRMLSAESKIYLHQIQTGRLNDEQMKNLYRDGVQKLADLKIFIDDSHGLTIMSLRAKARRLKKKHDIGLIIVDYLQLMTGEDDKNREREIAKISRGLKRLAKELSLPIIALSQLNRAIDSRVGKKRVPQLSDLRESGAIEQDADVVIFLWGPEEEEIEADASLLTRRYAKIAKARNGMLLTVELEFQNEIQLFSEYEGDHGMSSLPIPKGMPPGSWMPFKED